MRPKFAFCYEGVVFWADAIIVSTPIRRGSASSLYFKMIERRNCIQNQITLRNRVLMRNKIASFIITGGQDNVQAVAGQMLMFFGELGCQFPQFPFIAHSRGWSAEDMERNVNYVRRSDVLREGVRALAGTSAATATVPGRRPSLSPGIPQSALCFSALSHVVFEAVSTAPVQSCVFHTPLPDRGGNCLAAGVGQGVTY